MATDTKTPTSFTAVNGSWTPSEGTQLAAIQTADTIRVNGSANNDEFWAGFTAFSIAAENYITNVRISVYFAGATSSSCAAQAGLYVGSTTYYATTQTHLSVSYSTHDYDWATNPAGGSWTPAAVNALTRMYVKTTDANPDVYVSYVEITVTYYSAVIPSVAESVTVTDTPSIYSPASGTVTANIAETVTVTDLIGWYQDTVWMSDTSTVSVEAPTGDISIPTQSDTITVTDTVEFKIPIIPILAGDSVVVTDTPSATCGALGISANESVGCTDSPILEIVDEIASTENVSVTDSVSTPLVYVPDIVPFVGDLIAVSDSAGFYQDTVWTSDAPTVSVQAAPSGPLSIDKTENVTATDTPTIAIPFLGVSVVESVTLTDTPTKAIPFIGVSALETVTPSDAPTVRIPFVGISVAENVTVTDTPTKAIPFLGISVAESVTLTETSVVGTGNVPILIFESTVTVTDSPTVFRPTLAISIEESVTITDSPSVQIPFISLSVVESITVTDTPIIRIQYLVISTSQDVTITDTPSLKIPFISISSSESVFVSDSPVFAVGEDKFINVSDTITLTDAGEILSYTPVPLVLVGDLIAATDTTGYYPDTVWISDIASVVSSGPVMKSVSESISVIDTPGVSVGNVVGIQASETITVYDLIDRVVYVPVCSIPIAELITIQDVVGYYRDTVFVLDRGFISLFPGSPIGINVSESIIITDTPNLTQFGPISIYVVETITTTDISGFYGDTVFVRDIPVVNAWLPYVPISVTQNVLVTDTPTVWGFDTKSINVSDSVTVTDAPSIVPTAVVPILVGDLVSVIDSCGYYPDTLFISDIPHLHRVWGLGNIEVEESISVSDTPTIYRPQLSISVIDTVTLEDTVGPEDEILFIDDYPTVQVSGDRSILVAETVSITDSPFIRVPFLGISKSELVTLTDIPSVYLPAIKISTSDSVNVIDSATVGILVIGLSVLDTITVSDAMTIASRSYRSVSDSVAVTDSAGIAVVSINRIVNVIDGIFVQDSVSVGLSAAQISTGDSVTITDSPTISSSIIFVFVNDSVAIVDTVNVTGGLTVQDNIHIIESVIVKIQIIFKSDHNVAVITYKTYDSVVSGPSYSATISGKVYFATVVSHGYSLNVT